MNGNPMQPSPDDEGQYRSIFEAAADGLIITDLESELVLEANRAATAMHGYSRQGFIGLHPAAFIHPDSQEGFADFLRATRSGITADAQVQHVRQDGSTFHAEWRAVELAYLGRPCLLGAVRDVSRRNHAEQRLRQRVDARSREQAALLRFSHALASSLELQPVLILDQLRGIVECTYAALFGLADSTFTALAVRGSAQLEQAAPLQVRLQGPETLAALFNDHRPIRIADVGSAEPAAEFLRSLLSRDAPALLEGVRAWMWVPLAVKGRVTGGLGLAHARRGRFTAHHASLALSVADQVALAMVNAELHDQARELAVLQERQRLARNLHDAVNQSLFSAGLIAEVLPRLWARDPIEAQQSLEDVRRLTRGALAEMRVLLAELRPSVLTDSNLSDLLRQLGSAFTGRTNVPVEVTIAGDHALSAELQVALYRICQEALSNIAKHAEASRVEIDICLETAAAHAPSPAPRADAPQKTAVCSVSMLIRDNGRGFDPTQPPVSGHYGLAMMRERAAAVGARLTITSEPGHGTEVGLRWPAAARHEVR